MQNTKRLVMVIVTVLFNLYSIQSAAQEDRSADQQEWPGFYGTQAASVRSSSKVSLQGRMDDSSAKYKAEIKKIDKHPIDRSVEKNQNILENYFQDDIAEFIIKVHIEKSNLCSDYKNESERIPNQLKNKWVTEDTNGYCAATNESNRGSINSSICKDVSLQKSRSEQNRRYSVEDCTKALSEFRKSKKSAEKIQNEIDKLEELSEQEAYRNNDKDDLDDIKQKRTEANCEECAEVNRGYSYYSTNNKSSQTQMVNQLMTALSYSMQMRNQYGQVQSFAQQGYPSTMMGMGSYGMGQQMGMSYSNPYSNYNMSGYSSYNPYSSFNGYSTYGTTTNMYASSYYNPYSSYYYGNSMGSSSGLGYPNYANYNYYNQYPYSTSGLAYSGTYYNNSGSPTFTPTTGYDLNGSYSTGNIYTSGR